MDLLKTQAVLTRIYTDAAFRQRFFSDPLAAGGEMSLLPEDSQQMVQLSMCQVRFFADSLVRKRLKELRKLLPLTHRLLGPEFGRQFRCFADVHGLTGERQHQQDAIAFVAFLERASLPDCEASSWILELARYEAVSLQAAEPGLRFRLLYSRHHIPQWAWRMSRGEAVGAPAAQATLSIWLRCRPRGRLRYFVLSIRSGFLGRQMAKDIRQKGET